ncbi:MAG: helicase [Cressdnaviricota sp.]|nr:MAG: helicase [Cressdnaviricota sp.]
MCCRMPAKQTKFWPFTWYPPIEVGADGAETETVAQRAERALEAVRETGISQHITYIVAQAELCPTTKRLHIQGYVECKERWSWHRTRSDVFDQYMPGACFAAARGSASENKRYCTKLESRMPGTEPVEIGDAQGDAGETHNAGKALDRVFADIKAGDSMEAIIDKYGFGMFVRHERALKSAMCTWGKRRDAMPKVVLLIGPSGSGKSRWVQRTYPRRYRMTFGNGGNSAWFDGYNGEDVIELSEFRGQLQLAFMLDLLDRYELKVQTKGGTTQCVSSTVVITSNDEPTEWYPMMEGRDEKLKPLLRRIEEYGTRPRYQTENRLATLNAGE